MFPNIRLQILALFVSVIALSCGFGVFAALRVNHEPLGRLSANAAPLQLAAADAAPIGATAPWGAPFGSRFWLSETQIHGAADLPALTPVVRHDVTGRTITWIVVTGSVSSVPAATLQPPPALPDVQSVEAARALKQGDAPDETAAPQAGPTAVVGAAESAAQGEPKMTNTVPEPKLREVPVSVPRKAARAAMPRRHVATRALVRPQGRFQSGQDSKFDKPVVFQTAPPPFQPQKGASVVAPQNSTLEPPVFATAPPSQH